MTGNPTLILIGDLILAVGMIFVVLFTFFYGIRSRWSKELVGRSLFSFSLSCSVILLLSAYSRAAAQFGWPFPARDWVRIVAYSAVTASLIFQFITLVLYQHRDRKKRKALESQLKALEAQKEGTHMSDDEGVDLVDPADEQDAVSTDLPDGEITDETDEVSDEDDQAEVGSDYAKTQEG